MTTTAAQAIRTNFRDAGFNDVDQPAGLWFGRNPKGADTGAGFPVTLKRRGRAIEVHTLTGAFVDDFGDTAKFWIIPAGAEDAARAAAAEQAAARDAAYAAQEAERRAAGRATLAGKPAPAHATWVYDRETGDRVGYLSEFGVIDLPAEPEPAAPAPVVIIPCGAKKARGRVRAVEKYVGPYARSARRAGEAVAARTGARILTLSARFGLLTDDDLVDDYDLKMGDVGSVTAATVAEQAARLGVTDALVTVIAGKAYADVISTVWPHAIRVLDGAPSFGAQRARMAEIERGDWSPALPAGATATPALFGADLVAPPTAEIITAAQMKRGHVLAAGSFGLKSADPVLIVASAVAADVVHDAPRVEFAFRSGPGRTVTAVAYADSRLELVGLEAMPPRAQEAPLEPITDAEILEGPMPTPAPAQTGGGYISLPVGCSLPEYGLLPSNVVVVLARGEFWNSQYRKTGPDTTMHIVNWGLPGVALCRTTLVATEGREEYAGRDGTFYRHTGAPANLAGREDARYGYPGESTCEGCLWEMARANREGLPWQILHPMKDERRRIRQAQRAAAAERRELHERINAEHRAERAAAAALEAVEPVDLTELVDTAPAAAEGERVPVSSRGFPPADGNPAAAALEDVPAVDDERQRDLFGELVDPAVMAAAGALRLARADQPAPSPTARGPDVRSPLDRPDLHTSALFPDPHL